jgi:general secretion pathway protein A
MYLDHFGLHRQPFSEHASAEALWQDTRMEEGLARLDYLVAQGTLGLVTGSTGVGKSALLKRFLSTLPQQQCEAIYCHLTHLPSASLLKLVVTQLGEVPRFGKDRVYKQILQRASRAEATLLLIFDEAHLLDGDALIDLRLLISSALDVGPPLKILLVGQDSLRHVLRQSRHTDLLNRVSVRYQFKPLTCEQTLQYLDFQMTGAGGDAKVFDESVKTLIHDFTGGIPRQINSLATACLLQAVARNAARIDERLFQAAAGEFQLS